MEKVTKTRAWTKSELADLLGISSRQLAKLMNVSFYDELVMAGYQKDSKFITPKVLRAFFTSYGLPFSLNDLID